MNENEIKKTYSVGNLIHQTGGTEVIPSETAVPGATSLANLNIDGNDWSVAGATPEQIAQIDANKRDITNLKNTKQDKLVSGTNIKTINGDSILGTGNIVIQGEAGSSPKRLAEVDITRTNIKPYLLNQEDTTNVVDIICFAGQSNSCGRASLDDFTTDLDFMIKVPINEAFTFNNNASITSEPVEIVEPISANGSSGYGYIPAFLKSYYDTCHRQVCTCYMSVGGTMLNRFMPYQIDPNDGHKIETPTTYFNNIVKRINDIKAWISHNKKILGHIYLVWCQGESDGAYYGYENAYANYDEARLTTFSEKKNHYKSYFIDMITALQAQCGLETAIIFSTGYHKSKDNITKAAPIIQAFFELGTRPDCILATNWFTGGTVFEERDGRKVDLMRDNSHFKPEGYIRSGLEAGVNAGIWTLSKHKVKPRIFNYNNVFLLENKENVNETYKDRPMDTYIFDPQYVSLESLHESVSNKLIGIEVIPPSYENNVGSSITLKIEYIPASVSEEEKGITYVVNDPDSVIKFDELTGKVDLIKEGHATITVISSSNPSIRKDVGITVSKGNIPVESIKIKNTENQAILGSTLALDYEVLPSTATNPAVNVSVSPAVAAEVVNNHSIKFLDLGPVKIKVASQSQPDIYAEKTIEVIESPIVEKTLLDLNFAEHDVPYYENLRILTYGDSTGEGASTDAEGLTCSNETGLTYGLKLLSPIMIPDTWKIEFTAKIDPSETVPKGIMIGVVSNGTPHIDHSYGCIAPSIISFLDGDLQVRFTEADPTSQIYKTFFLQDGLMHTYTFEMEESFVFAVYIDGKLINRSPKTITSQGTWGYIFGVHKGYPSTNYGIKSNQHVKRLKITTKS